ncbi:MAG: class I SAM-dependent methyltransferase [Planctomycetaceae bacterium]|nr:class I SAM-dependent methyltransferase [Planctomycetaceae bacterium]
MTNARPMHRRRTTCRACGSGDLELFLPLGNVALANSFLRSPAEFEGELRFPLDVYFCRGCSMVQLCDVIDPEVLFRNYLYVTGTSDTIAKHNVGYAKTVVELVGGGKDALVVEAASNDGSLLKCFQAHGVRVLGVEPATNIAEKANAAGVPTTNEFFDAKKGAELRTKHGPAKAVIGNNVLAHVDDPVDFLRGFKALLAEDGLAICEVPELAEFVERLEYDTVYHEHLSYFSVTSLMRVCEEAGLRVVRVDHVPVHGGSVRMYAAPVERVREHAPEVVAMSAKEKSAGIASAERLRRFAREVEAQRAGLLELLENLHAEKRTVGAYGAPAKGNTLLNYCGITTRLVPWTVDKSPLKVGLYTPGSHLPVLAASELLERQPDFCLILAWNFAEEIQRQQAEYARRGGRFILPIPRARVL